MLQITPSRVKVPPPPSSAALRRHFESSVCQPSLRADGRGRNCGIKYQEQSNPDLSRLLQRLPPGKEFACSPGIWPVRQYILLGENETETSFMRGRQGDFFPIAVSCVTSSLWTLVESNLVRPAQFWSAGRNTTLGPAGRRIGSQGRW